MCTVTYIPKGDNQFILTSNRDENKSRSISRFETKLLGTQEVMFPVDPVSGGSWIAVSRSNRVACILNGAFEKHSHNPPYSRSRGLILLDFFESPGALSFANNFVFHRVEPFTMVLYQQNLLVELRWDGATRHIKEISLDSPHIWSSCTLYDQSARARRTSWFKEWWPQNRNPQANDLLQFHQHGGAPDSYNGLVINRDNKVQTLSITGVEKKSSLAIFHHYDLIDRINIKKSIDFSRNEIMESY